MSKYCCEKCGKDFKQKSHYTTHINKKKPCVVDVTSKQVIDNAVKEKLGLVEMQIDCDTVGKISITKPLLKWVGGKTQILEKLLGEFPVEMNNYREIFLGGGSVLLSLLSQIKAGKIIVNGTVYASDFNSNLIGLYKNIQNTPDEFITEVKKLIVEFSNCKDTIINRK